MSDQVERVKWWGFRRKKSGYVDMGPIRIPLIPEPLVLTDRADGSKWMLSFSSAQSPPDSDGRVSLNSISIEQFYGQRIPQAQDGIYICGYILFIRSGRLGIDDEWLHIDADTEGPPQFARMTGNQLYRQLVINNPTNGPQTPVRIGLLSVGDPQDG